MARSKNKERYFKPVDGELAGTERADGDVEDDAVGATSAKEGVVKDGAVEDSGVLMDGAESTWSNEKTDDNTEVGGPAAGPDIPQDMSANSQPDKATGLHLHLFNFFQLVAVSIRSENFRLIQVFLCNRSFIKFATFPPLVSSQRPTVILCFTAETFQFGPKMGPTPAKIASQPAKTTDDGASMTGDISQDSILPKGANATPKVSSIQLGSDGRVRGSTKAERNIRKKENLKKRKAEARSKVEEEERLLDEMSFLALEEKEEGNAQASPNISNTNEGPMPAESVQPKTFGSYVRAAGNASIPDTPPELLFTFRECPDKRGIGAFARGAIKNGTEILIEEAIIRDVQEWISKEALFKVLSKDKQDAILALQSQCTCKASPCLETPLMKVWSVNAYEAVTGPMLYCLASRFNHDCFPNIARGFSKEDYIVFRAARDIEDGEELTINYILSPISSEARRALLLDKFGFVCECWGCKSNRAYTVSDLVDSILLPGVETKSLAIGKYTREEIATRAEVKAWSEEVKTEMQTIQVRLYNHLKRLVDAGDHSVSDRNGRAAIVEQSIRFIDRYLKGNNKFGFDDAFFYNYRARITQFMIDLTELNFIRILVDLEELRGKGIAT
ncbi:hypothetical protein DL95DRAFT_509558 [Leptodontidium sp. 2 PMI_412]|nr:hypothetical protein DL95DRAFT_509558 [Leptodontidium sp. 2 PMI_412]